MRGSGKQAVVWLYNMVPTVIFSVPFDYFCVIISLQVIAKLWGFAPL